MDSSSFPGSSAQADPAWPRSRRPSIHPNSGAMEGHGSVPPLPLRPPWWHGSNCGRTPPPKTHTSTRTITMGRLTQDSGPAQYVTRIQPGPFAEVDHQASVGALSTRNGREGSVRSLPPRNHQRGRGAMASVAAAASSCSCSTVLSSSPSTPFRARTPRPSLRPLPRRARLPPLRPAHSVSTPPARPRPAPPSLLSTDCRRPPAADRVCRCWGASRNATRGSRSEEALGCRRLGQRVREGRPGPRSSARRRAGSRSRRWRGCYCSRGRSRRSPPRSSLACSRRTCWGISGTSVQVLLQLRQLPLLFDDFLARFFLNIQITCRLIVIFRCISFYANCLVVHLLFTFVLNFRLSCWSSFLS